MSDAYISGDGTPGGLWGEEDVTFSDLEGKALLGIYTTVEDVLWFDTDDGLYLMYHPQDCCESVYIAQVDGDPLDLRGAHITLAEETSNDDDPPTDDADDSFTWTFYKLQTPKGDLTIRWFGASNGYYSESANLYKWPTALPEDAVLWAPADGGVS
jgi:hypothetical protein